MPLDDAYTGTSNLGDLSLDGISSIEVYRGFSPPHLGSSSIGGVINLRTDTGKGTGGPAAIDTEARASYGSFETSRYAVSLWPSRGRVRAFLQGSYLDTEGDFDFLDDKGTPENPADDEETLRVNNDSETIDLLGRVDVDLASAGSSRSGTTPSSARTAFRGSVRINRRRARAERTKQITYLKFDASRCSRKGSRRPRTASTRRRTRSSAIWKARSDSRARTRTTTSGATAEIFVRWPDLPPVTLELFLEGKSELFRPRSNVPHAHGRSRQDARFVLGGSLR